MMKIKSLLAAVAIAAAAPGAFAQGCTSTSSLGTLSGTTLFGNWFSSAQSFNDCFGFTLGSAGDLSGGITELDLSFKFDVDVTSVSLLGSGGAQLLDTTPGSFSFSNLTAGAYQLVVRGNVDQVAPYGTLLGVGYAGAISATPSITAPVPEPETYAMLAMGLGLVGWVTRRRKRG